MLPTAPAEHFIRSVTAPARVPFVPEIVLFQALDAIALWEQTEQRAGVNGLPPPFWAFPWAGGQALARYVLDHPDTVRGRRVLDLAAGCGLVSVAAKLAGAARVVADEVDPTAVAAIGLNATANDVVVEALLADLLVPGLPARTSGVGEHDVVLAGDVFYQRDMADAVWPYLQRHVAAGALVLVGDPGRGYPPASGIVELARYEVPVVRDLEDRDTRSTAVLRIA